MVARPAGDDCSPPQSAGGDGRRVVKPSEAVIEARRRAQGKPPYARLAPLACGATLNQQSRSDAGLFHDRPTTASAKVRSSCGSKGLPASRNSMRVTDESSKTTTKSWTIVIVRSGSVTGAVI